MSPASERAARIDTIERLTRERDEARADLAAKLTACERAASVDSGMRQDLRLRASMAERERDEARVRVAKLEEALRKCHAFLAPLRSTAPDSLSELHDIVIAALEDR